MPGFLAGLAGLVPAAVGAYGALRGSRGRNNPGNASSEYLNQIPGQGQQAYNPFIESGQQAEQQLNPITSQFAQNPFDVYNNIMGQYQPSPGYQYRESQLNKAAGNTAAAGGFAGTENDVANRSSLINDLMGGDMQQFLQNILGIQGTGLAGLESRVGRGAAGAEGLANHLGVAAGAQARNAGSGQNYQNNSRANAYSSLASLVGGGVNAYNASNPTPTMPQRSVAGPAMNYTRNLNLSNPFMGVNNNRLSTASTLFRGR